jgi:glycosyltransferase involved in cell wall biosynthesis
MARRALTIAQGDALTQQYSGPERVVVNLLESPVGAGDIWVRESTALHEPIRLLYVGALLEKKAVHLLVESVAKLASDVNITLALVGSGPTEVQLRAQALQLGIDERVTFVGSVGSDIELMKHYRAADVFVMPSSAEGVPRVLLEAMAQSLPVVSTAVGGVPDLIRDGWNGVLVEPNSVGALCTAIRSVVHDQTLRQRLMARGLETVRLHTREAHAAELVRVLGEYLRTHPAVGGGSVGASDAADSRE